MKTVLAEPLTITKEELKAFSKPLTENGNTFESYDSKPESAEEWIRRIGDADQVILANTPMPAEVLEQTPNLKYMNIAFTGTDHAPVEEAKARDILVSNASGYSNEGVAELVIGMAVALLRKFPSADTAVRNGGRAADFLGAEIAGRTVGIVGTGHIGKRVAELFHAMGAKLVGYNRSEHEEVKELGLRYVSMEELLKVSDIVTIHLPNTPDTRNFLSAKEFSQMKPTAILINAARGPIVNSSDLAKALEDGVIAAAGVDVFNEEPPLSPDEPLLKAPHTILTPHIAYFTKEAMEKRAKIVFENAAAFVEGREVHFLV